MEVPQQVGGGSPRYSTPPPTNLIRRSRVWEGFMWMGGGDMVLGRVGKEGRFPGKARLPPKCIQVLPPPLQMGKDGSPPPPVYRGRGETTVNTFMPPPYTFT